MNLKVGDISIENSTCEKLLGVKVDNKRTFNEHVDEITIYDSSHNLIYQM